MARPALSLEIADRLRRDILRGRLAPGQPIKEREYAVEMDVSRTPMREAIRLLAKEGLVTLRPARSPVVARPSSEEIVGAAQVLRALEALSGELACAAASDGEIAEIRALLTRLNASVEEDDPLALFERDMALHVAIARASHNPALIETHAAFLARLWRVRYLTGRRARSRSRVLRQHDAIVAALEARDPERARAEIEEHLGDLTINVRAVYEDETAPSAAVETERA
ncbi:MAG: GntR family transcriptional regulator [Pseudomonadota bacterium]